MFFVGDRVRTAADHGHLAFQPRNMQSATQVTAQADEMVWEMGLDPKMQQELNVPELFTRDGMSPGDSLCHSLHSVRLPMHVVHLLCTMSHLQKASANCRVVIVPLDGCETFLQIMV